MRAMLAAKGGTMRNLLLFIGVMAVVFALTRGGILHGDMCADPIGCVGAHGNTLTLHPPGTKTP